MTPLALVVWSICRHKVTLKFSTLMSDMVSPGPCLSPLYIFSDSKKAKLPFSIDVDERRRTDGMRPEAPKYDAHSLVTQYKNASQVPEHLIKCMHNRRFPSLSN